MAEVIDNKRQNPLIVVTPEETAMWLRQLADDLGYSDRASAHIQVAVTDAFGERRILNGAPELVLMVSNIPNSREKAEKPALTDREG